MNHKPPAVSEDRRPATCAPDAGGRVVRDIPYRDAVGPHADRCRLDLYLPDGVRDFPTVVWFHGGGLTSGERFIPDALRGQGIAVAAAGYRLSPGARCPAYIEDTAAAVAWVFRNIAAHGGSISRVHIAGASAGGYLSLLVGLDRRWLAAHDIDANRIAGITGLTGQAITHFAVREERGVSATQPVVDEFAPLRHVRKDAPPVLLVTGDRDLELLGRYEENAYLQRMLRVSGHTANKLIEVPGADHGAVEAAGHPHLLRFVRGGPPFSKP